MAKIPYANVNTKQRTPTTQNIQQEDFTEEEVKSKLIKRYSMPPEGGALPQEAGPEVGKQQMPSRLCLPPQEGAQEQGLGGIGKQAKALAGIPHSLCAPVSLHPKQPLALLFVCAADGGLPTSGGKFLESAQATVDSKEIRQWA